LFSGLSPAAPIAFVSFGSLLAKLGSLKTGHEFTKLAKSLLEKMGEKEYAGEVLFMVAVVACLFEPLQSSNLHTRGEAECLAVGDGHFACFNRMMDCINIFWSGLNLSDVNRKLVDACAFMNKQQHKAGLAFVMTVQRTVLMLIGQAEMLAGNDVSRTVQEGRSPCHMMHL
jgi:hypothetical protein